MARQALGLLMLCLAGMGLGLGFVMGPNQAAARYLEGLAGVSIISVLINGGSDTDVLAGHRLCLWIYIAAHAVAMLLAVVLPNEIRALKEPARESPLTP